MKDKALWSQFAKQSRILDGRKDRQMSSDRDIKRLHLCGSVYNPWQRDYCSQGNPPTRFQILEFPFQEGTEKNPPCISKRIMNMVLVSQTGPQGFDNKPVPMAQQRKRSPSYMKQVNTALSYSEIINDKIAIISHIFTYKFIYQELLNQQLKLSSQALFKLLHLLIFSFKGMPTELSKAALSSQHTAVLGGFSFSEVTHMCNLPSCLD